MKYDIVIAGVGGQGILTIAAIVDEAALASGLHLKQSEVHGMAQRGGAVIAHLRLSDRPIFSDLVPLGCADLLLAVEPLEALRQIAYLRAGGALVVNTAPVHNIADYPEVERIAAQLECVGRCLLFDAEKPAAEAGSKRAVNVVLLGAASPVLPVRKEMLQEVIRRRFAVKGDAVVQANLKAFELGRAAARAGALSAVRSNVAS